MRKETEENTDAHTQKSEALVDWPKQSSCLACLTYKLNRDSGLSHIVKQAGGVNTLDIRKKLLYTAEKGNNFI